MELWERVVDGKSTAVWEPDKSRANTQEKM